MIGQSADHISGNKLPSLGKMLQYVLHLKESSPVTTPLKKHLSDAVDEVQLIWSRAGIKTVTKQNAIMRLKKEYDNSAKTKHVYLILEKNVKYLLKLYQSYGIYGLQMRFRRSKKIRYCQRRGKLKTYYFMKTSRVQEKVLLKGKMHCVRKAFKNDKKNLPDQLLSPVEQ